MVEQWGKGEKTSRNARVRISQLIFRSRCENAPDVFCSPLPGSQGVPNGGKIQPGWDRLLLRKMVKEWYAVAAAFYDQVWRAGGMQGDEGLVWNGMTMRKKKRRS